MKNDTPDPPPPAAPPDDPLDPELEAMIAIYEALQPLDNAAQRRAVSWVRSRLKIIGACPRCGAELYPPR